MHLQSIVNLKNLLKGTRQTKANTTYLVRAAAEDEPEAVSEDKQAKIQKLLDMQIYL